MASDLKFEYQPRWSMVVGLLFSDDPQKRAEGVRIMEERERELEDYINSIETAAPNDPGPPDVWWSTYTTASSFAVTTTIQDNITIPITLTEPADFFVTCSMHGNKVLTNTGGAVKGWVDVDGPQGVDRATTLGISEALAYDSDWSLAASGNITLGTGTHNFIFRMQKEISATSFRHEQTRLTIMKVEFQNGDAININPP